MSAGEVVKGNPSSVPGVPGWTYQAPRRPKDHPDQCYYRAGERGGLYIHTPGRGAGDDVEMTLFRFRESTDAELFIEICSRGLAKIGVTLGVAEMVALRDALNDALHDVAEAQAEAERRASFERISEELRIADEMGVPPGCLYGHPDVHYVPADQVQAKMAELEAAGAARYIVLPLDEGAPQ